MSRRIVTTQQQQYTISPADEPPPGLRTWAVLQLRLFDELTDQPQLPPRGLVTLRALTPHTTPRVATDGLAGLVGVPQLAFPALRTQAYPVRAHIEADGYLAQEIEQTLPLQSAFPHAFTPLPWLDVPLHRQPVTLHGRTLRRNGAGTVTAAGARVEITEISRSIRPAPAAVAYQPAHLVSLSPPLATARQAGIAALAGRNYSDEKRLVENAPVGANQIALSNRQNLSVGDTLWLDALQPARREQHTINTLSGGLNPGEPVTVTLAAPLAQAHARNAVALKDNGGVPWASVDFAVDALPGDVCVFLTSAATVADGYALAADNPPAVPPLPDEMFEVRRFVVTSDAQGYYRLPPLHRVAQAKIHAELIISPATYETEVEFRPDYTQAENQLDLILAP